MISPDGTTGLLPRPRSAPAGAKLEFGAVLAVLLVTGWVANHFVALMPTISDRQHLSRSTLDAIGNENGFGSLRRSVPLPLTNSSRRPS